MKQPPRLSRFGSESFDDMVLVKDASNDERTDVLEKVMQVASRKLRRRSKTKAVLRRLS